MLRPITLVKYASVLFIYAIDSFTYESNITDEYGIQQCLKCHTRVSYSCILIIPKMRRR